MVPIRSENDTAVDGRTYDEDERGGKSRMSHYGCYCSPHDIAKYPEDWVGSGRPVDQLDAVCRGLFWGL